MSRSGNPARRGWDPLEIGPARRPPEGSIGMAAAFYATDGQQHWYRYREPQRATACLAFSNRLYNGFVLVFEDESMHLTFKRNDRSAVRDWRHFQAIKNEVAGSEREGIEIFPPESMLVDAANEYHLWVLPPDKLCPVGFDHDEPQLLDGGATHDQARYRQTGKSGYAQRGWEPGIPTGLGTR